MGDTLYITDLDGTLLDKNDRVPEEAARILRSLLKRGLLFTCATARSWSSAQKVTAGVEFTLPVIVYNGAFLVDPQTGRRLVEHIFTSEQQGELQKHFCETGISPIVYAFVNGEEKVSWNKGLENGGISYYLRNRKGDRRLRPVETAEELYRGKPFYFTCIGTREELLPLWERVKGEKRWNVTFQQELYREEYWLEIMPERATKAHAARELKKRLNCQRLVVFGDAVNDLPLFQAAEESYAVANAVPELRARATGIIAGNEESGVANWLLEHGSVPG